MHTAYHRDLAWIHDAGFGSLAEAAAPAVIELLSKGGLRRGLVVELGCGSGILAERLTAAGYDVLGYDLSAAMLEIARRRAPSAEFRQRSFLDAELPRCAAVTAVGEILCYLFDERNVRQRLAKLFNRVFRALEPGGWFVFDIATPGRGGLKGGHRSYIEGEGWACLVETAEDRGRSLLTREITSFRKNGAAYTRDHETHRLRLYEPTGIAAQLRASGFRVRVRRSYGAMRLPRGHVVLVARKPE